MPRFYQGRLTAARSSLHETSHHDQLTFARACGQFGAHVCTEVRPAIQDGAKMLSRGTMSVVPSRTAEVDRLLADYRQAGCAFSNEGATASAAQTDECLGALGSPTCQ